MAEPDPPTFLTNGEVAIHTVLLVEDAKVLVLVQASAHVTHVISLTPDAVRRHVVGLLDALDVVDPSDGWPFDEPPRA